MAFLTLSNTDVLSTVMDATGYYMVQSRSRSLFQTCFFPTQNTTFQDTPIMSTYLLAFMILSDYECTDVKYSSMGTMVIACAPTLSAGSLQFPQAVGLSVVDFIANLYGVPYTLSKVHLVAIPDFAAGAMVSFFFFFFALKETKHGN